MVYRWADIEKALEMVRAFPWECKLKKAEYFSDACDMVKLFEAVNEAVHHPFACDPWYAEDYRKKKSICTDMDAGRTKKGPAGM